MIKHINIKIGMGGLSAMAVLITGASTGIGKELAYHFAKNGHHLVLVARSKDKLQTLAASLRDTFGVDVYVIAKNLERMDSVKEVYEEVQREGITVDYLVNNAGFGVFGSTLETDWDQESGMIELNVKALTYLTKLFVPDMVKRGKGGILQVASTAAFQPGPLMAVYYATKAYVLSYSEALENELRGSGVTVTVLCPGPTRTDFADRAKLEQSKLFNSGVMDVQTVAKIGYDGFMKGKRIVIPGIKNRLLACLVRFLPRKLVTDMVRYVQDRIA
jgi:short-subunit dehydrogenase